MFDLNDICAADRGLQRGDDDGWVTINGTHVMVSGGKAVGGATASKLSGYDFSGARSTKSKSSSSGSKKIEKKEHNYNGPVDYDNPEYLKLGEKAFKKEVTTTKVRGPLENMGLMMAMPLGTQMKIKNPKTGKTETYEMVEVEQHDPIFGSWNANQWVKASDKGKSNIKNLTVNPQNLSEKYMGDQGVKSSFKLPKGDIMDLADAIMVYEENEVLKNEK